MMRSACSACEQQVTIIITSSFHQRLHGMRNDTRTPFIFHCNAHLHCHFAYFSLALSFSVCVCVFLFSAQHQLCVSVIIFCAQCDTDRTDRQQLLLAILCRICMLCISFSCSYATTECCVGHLFGMFIAIDSFYAPTQFHCKHAKIR